MNNSAKQSNILRSELTSNQKMPGSHNKSKNYIFSGSKKILSFLKNFN